jgi:hypothetical protein
MHLGNLSFMSENGRPYHLAPAYDMLPMSFAPTAGGGIKNTLAELALPAFVPPETWPLALAAAKHFLSELRSSISRALVSGDFSASADAIEQRLLDAERQIERLDVRPRKTEP